MEDVYISMEDVSITITTQAYAVFRKKSTHVRIGISGSGGCAGYFYVIQYDATLKAGDRILPYDDLTIFIDPKSFYYLNGTTVDYEVSLMRQEFVFKNPRAQSYCGCGQSFSVEEIR